MLSHQCFDEAVRPEWAGVLTKELISERVSNKATRGKLLSRTFLVLLSGKKACFKAPHPSSLNAALHCCDSSNVTTSSPASYSCLTANCKVVPVSQGRWWASCTNHFLLWALLVRLIGWSIIWTAGKASDHRLLGWKKGCNHHHKSSSSLKTWSVSHSSKSLPLPSLFVLVKTTVRIRIHFHYILALRKPVFNSMGFKTFEKKPTIC